MIIQTSTVQITPTADLQAAIDATPAGGTLYLAPGIFVLPTDAGITISSPITIIGSGSGTPDGTANGAFVSGSYGTIIQPHSSGGYGFKITSDDVLLRDLMIANPSKPTTLGTGDGINLVTTSAIVTHFELDRVTVWNMGRDGLHIDGTAKTVNLVSLNNSQFKQCGRHGIYMASVSYPAMYRVWTAANRFHGFFSDGSVKTVMISCFCENNCFDTTQANDPLRSAQTRLKLTHAFTVIGCSFEGFWGNTCNIGLAITNCYGGSIEGCFFGNPTVGGGGVNPSLAQLQATSGIILMDNTQGVRIGSNTYDYVNTLARVNSETGANCGNSIALQVVHNTLSGLDGNSSVPASEPTVGVFAETDGDPTILGAPVDAPGGLFLPPSAKPPDARAVKGMIYCDTSGVLWICTVSGPTPTWVKVGSQ